VSHRRGLRFIRRRLRRGALTERRRSVDGAIWGGRFSLVRFRTYKPYRC
jgi:hypothetical protein